MTTLRERERETERERERQRENVLLTMWPGPKRIDGVRELILFQ
jgi:hypothetical protein